ncbi:ABC-type multidrug/protein/lipid transport system, ATPase component [Treponema primitia ZAS-2]|uniref:ABC-type multidrug/protein/lipid transport system, ATPase component n=1 Tax=Treponema primitia (strain ATCC BAA-887 / DSM 12427 / ZAS-2) TaxID=545694 RepID=F5YP69_TREPZ|nr:ABC transporter ATP-binding protein [Treponema primitia]AEF83608.1 ABC-type multidrug/protein/lipid transport system, ATPase component [Treponema primitia ZAS-2]
MKGTATTKQKNRVSLGEYRAILPYLTRYRKQYILGFLCLMIVDAAQVLIPQFTRRAVDLIAAGGGSASDRRSIIILCLCMIGAMALISSGRFLWRYFIHGSSRRIEMELRDRLFDRLLTLSYDFYQENKIGDLMARATNDVGAVRNAIGMGLVALVDGTVLAAAILVIVFIQDARTASFAVLPILPITVLILRFGNTVGKQFHQAQETYSAMSDTVQETFAGIRVVKSFVKEWWFVKKFADTNDDYRDANMALVKTFGLFFPFITFLSGITTLILLLVGGGRVVEGLMSPGELVALFGYLQMLIWPLMGAGFMVNLIQRGAVSLGRVNAVLNTQPSIAPPSYPKRPDPNLRGDTEIEIRNLSFAYKDKPVLENISLKVSRGSWVGILGRTGSGKSTLLKALTRMVDPPEGTVFVRGVDVRDWDPEELRSLFGVTPQDSYLFSDSIKNNIGYGLEDASDSRIQRSVELSALDRDLAGFTQGLDTLVGERGLTLSGGQKQRTAISRAVIMDTDFLILDDSLSAVDVETEKRVLRGLLEERERKLKGGGSSTAIIVSHRVSTLAYTDTVLVLDQGRITESGSPRELISRGGFYARMADLQRLEQGDLPNG